MRPSLIFLTLLPLHAAEIHVAPDGADGNSGEITKPLRTLRAAQGKARPGDTVWIRGGTYRMAESDVMEVHYGRAHVILLDKGGKDGKPISYLAYRDEKPVFDFFAVKPEGLRVTALRAKASHLHLRGIAFTGVQVNLAGHTQSINVENLGSHNLFERLSMHDGQGIGFWLGGGSDNLVLNCDAYRNYDNTSPSYMLNRLLSVNYNRQLRPGNLAFPGLKALFIDGKGGPLEIKSASEIDPYVKPAAEKHGGHTNVLYADYHIGAMSPDKLRDNWDKYFLPDKN